MEVVILDRPASPPDLVLLDAECQFSPKPDSQEGGDSIKVVIFLKVWSQASWPGLSCRSSRRTLCARDHGGGGQAHQADVQGGYGVRGEKRC